MVKFGSILCPVDFSAPSRKALRYAVALAGQDHALLTVVSVNEPLLVEAAAAMFDLDYLREETESQLRHLVSSVIHRDADWAPVPRLIATTGDPASEILAQAAATSADLVVMGTHGLGGYRKMFFGSTTERVLRQAEVPVLAVPPGGRDAVTLAAARPAIQLGEIIAPVDFSEVSEANARRAAEIARGFRAPLVLLHVLSEIRTPATWRDPVSAQDRIRRARAEQQLERLAEKVRNGLVVQTDMLAGRPADEIAAAAVERDAGLIVIGLGGHHGMLGSRPGSVAYRVMCLAAAPVLALPAARRDRGRESVRSDAT